MSLWIMLFVLAFFSFIFGMIANHLIEKKPAPWVGIIRIDRSDPEGPHLFFELSVPIEAIAAEKTVNVTVKNEDLIPRK